MLAPPFPQEPPVQPDQRKLFFPGRFSRQGRDRRSPWCNRIVETYCRYYGRSPLRLYGNVMRVITVPGLIINTSSQEKMRATNQLVQQESKTL